MLDGKKIEAHKYTTSVTSKSKEWNREKQQYSFDYDMHGDKAAFVLGHKRPMTRSEKRIEPKRQASPGGIEIRWTLTKLHESQSQMQTGKSSNREVSTW